MEIIRLMFGQEFTSLFATFGKKRQESKVKKKIKPLRKIKNKDDLLIAL